jgi:hypothetical protein
VAVNLRSRTRSANSTAGRPAGRAITCVSSPARRAVAVGSCRSPCDPSRPRGARSCVGLGCVEGQRTFRRPGEVRCIFCVPYRENAGRSCLAFTRKRRSCVGCVLG